VLPPTSTTRARRLPPPEDAPRAISFIASAIPACVKRCSHRGFVNEPVGLISLFHVSRRRTFPYYSAAFSVIYIKFIINLQIFAMRKQSVISCILFNVAFVVVKLLVRDNIIISFYAKFTLDS